MKIKMISRLTICILLMLAGSNSFSQSAFVNWAGIYYAEAKNKDNLKTSFNLNISLTGTITLKYVSDGEPEIIYKNVKAVFENPNKLKLTFDPKAGGMGILYLEKSEHTYHFSGEPVYYINPGSEELLAKKRTENKN